MAGNKHVKLTCDVMGDQGFDDSKDLLLLVTRESGDGFELAFELRLGAALRGPDRYVGLGCVCGGQRY